MESFILAFDAIIVKASQVMTLVNVRQHCVKYYNVLASNVSWMILLRKFVTISPAFGVWQPCMLTVAQLPCVATSFEWFGYSSIHMFTRM